MSLIWGCCRANVSLRTPSSKIGKRQIAVFCLKKNKHNAKHCADCGAVNSKDKDSLLFDHENDLRSYSGTRRLLKRFNDKYGFSKYDIHFHTFRHTFATMLFEKKVNPKIIQLLLGHKSVKTTLEIYNNVNDNIDELIIYVNNLFLNN